MSQPKDATTRRLMLWLGGIVLAIWLLGMLVNPPDRADRPSRPLPATMTTPAAPAQTPEVTPAMVRSAVLSAVKRDLADASRRAGEYPFAAFQIDEDGTVLFVMVSDYWFGIPKHLKRELAWSVRQLFQKHLREQLSKHQQTPVEPSAIVIFTDRTGHVVARATSWGADISE